MPKEMKIHQQEPIRLQSRVNKATQFSWFPWFRPFFHQMVQTWWSTKYQHWQTKILGFHPRGCLPKIWFQSHAQSQVTRWLKMRWMSQKSIMKKISNFIWIWNFLKVSILLQRMKFSWYWYVYYEMYLKTDTCYEYRSEKLLQQAKEHSG